ncbi:hypothetical protein APY94_04910 [Thermococcus celericrescens]|uniref:CARDB domain-containing protein n=1 Tax=Thermococcus celericrescens TaxID=227598 RepID=A0A100XYD0_9EURY|nr:CARDB domain-containing protein [Thermococcus celericrescens]KUH33709.1 hypothetical protein APY94_04910 [Thermococcus celericrescens]
MRRAIVFALVLMLLLPAGFASASSFNGWFSLPGSISLGNVTLEFRDVSLDGVLVGTAYAQSSYNDFSLSPGEGFTAGDVVVRYVRVTAAEGPVVFLNVTFPYIVEGETVRLGDYSIELLSVGSKGAKVRVSRGNESKDFTSGTFTFGNLKIAVSAYPKVFEGYLQWGQNVTISDHVLTFTNATVEESADGFTETLYFEYDGNEYSVVVGKEADIGPFHVKAEDLVGVEYAKVTVFFRGASLDVETVPDAVFSLFPGQTRNVGPYVLRYDYKFDGSIRASLLNSCGAVLATSKLSSGAVATGLYYKGATVILDGVEDDGKATFEVFLDKSKIPDVGKVANLLIEGTAEGGKRYLPMSIAFRVKNTGTVALSNVTLRFVPEGGVRVISGGALEIALLKPGEEKTFKVTVMPTDDGNVTLGRVVADVVAPFELACGGYTRLTFSSNPVTAYVEPSKVAYFLNASWEGDPAVYHPVTLRFHVRNAGDVSVPANLTVSVPEGVTIEPDGVFGSYGGGLVAPLSLAPGENVTFSVMVIPYSPGKKTFRVALNTIAGTVNSSTVALDIVAPTGNDTAVITKTITVTTTVPSNGTVTVTETSTETTSIESTVTEVQTVPYTPTTSKVVWMVIGIVIGALAVIIFAWYQAHRS